MLGIHTSKAGHVFKKKTKTMIEAIKRDYAGLGMRACQIFVQGPRNSRMANLDTTAIKSYCRDEKINLYVHSSYISVGIFSVTKANQADDKSIYAISNIVAQMAMCDALGALGLVVHLSKRTPADVLETMIVLEPHLKTFRAKFIFEQPAKKADGNLTYETPAKINALNKALSNIRYANWGWCIDTCHLWSAGIAVDKASTMEQWLNDVDPGKICLFHINGGLKALAGTGKDTHIIPMGLDDAIWGNTYKSLAVVIRYAKHRAIDCIMEINRGSLNDAKAAMSRLSIMFDQDS
jgi:endonuclease IV